MRWSDKRFAYAFATVLAMPASPAFAAPDERLHVEFPGGMPAFVQTPAYGGRDFDESSAQEYARTVSYGESVKPLLGYAVRPAPSGCDKPGLPCPSRRDALDDDRSADLPGGFNIEISDEPEAEVFRRPLRTAEIYPNGAGAWVPAASGQAPFTPRQGATTHLLATQAGKLRPGALAQADCYAVMGLCDVRITYARDLRVNFLTPASGETLTAQVRAVDAVMRTVIHPGPLPGQQGKRPSGRVPLPTGTPYSFPGLPLSIIQKAIGATH